MTIQITEILRRSDQGFTKPFICRADDGNIYFVKGNSAGRQSQVYEWIAGHLALKIGLPIAPFSLVDIPEELIQTNPLHLQDLGAGLAFGSQKQMITELTYSGINQVDDDLQKSVLAFDWWIKNEDRTLTESGGNPNLFWDPDKEKLVVIDHNLAFDDDFSIDRFKELHVFNRQNNQLFNNPANASEYIEKYKRVLNSWSEICDSLPEEWYYLDSEMNDLANIDLDKIYKILERCTEDSFWNIP